MKICEICITNHIEIVEENREKGYEITECCFEECEVGHPRFIPELPEELVALTERMKERTDHLESSPWGWVYIYSSEGVYYWWLRCSDLRPDHCSFERPSDSDTCDIHVEPWVYVDDLKAWFGGLINFGGCRPAQNCGGNGGLVNSKRNGACLRYYFEAPEIWDDGWLWCSYSNTGVTDCIFRTQYMIEDYLPGEGERKKKKPGLFKRVRRLFGLA
ncbi:MAG: hypothetical protein HXS44_03895 [Theionarchaea archaeon]|nr:hypothetical protein [Theionarchaea archaeon]